MLAETAVDYAACREALERAEADVSAAEFHGTLCALLCTRTPVRVDEWVDEIVVAEHAGAGTAWTRSLREAGERTRHALEAGECEIELLLPDDDAPMSERGEALSQWCEGFLYGLGLAGARAADALSDDAREVVSDLAELTRIDVEAEDSDGAETAFAEIVEYVRVGVLLIYEELARAASHAPGRARLH